jgi:hypothetical protein
MEEQPLSSRHKPLKPEDVLDRLVSASKKFKVLGALSKAQAQRVAGSLEVLKTPQTSARRRKYKLFLNHLLCNSAFQMILLCAVTLGQIKIAEMRDCDRDNLL